MCKYVVLPLILLFFAYTNCIAADVEIQINKNIIFTDYNGNTFFSNDYGITWTTENSNNNKLLSLKEILFTDYKGNQFYSNDYGVTWTPIELNVTKNQESLIGIKIYPNPTCGAFTVSFELDVADNMRIVLTDLFGSELVEIYDGFTNTGTFTRTVNTEHLVKGVYFLKVMIGNNFTVEKIVVH